MRGLVLSLIMILLLPFYILGLIIFTWSRRAWTLLGAWTIRSMDELAQRPGSALWGAGAWARTCPSHPHDRSAISFISCVGGSLLKIHSPRFERVERTTLVPPRLGVGCWRCPGPVPSAALGAL